MEVKVNQQESFDALGMKGSCIEFFSAYQDMDMERMLSLCEADGTVEFLPLGDSFRGTIREIGQGVWSALMNSFPDLDNTVREQIYDEATRSVTCRVMIFGTQEKEFAGIPSEGNGFDTEHIFIFRFSGESRISHISVNWDHDGFVRSLKGLN